MCIRDSFQTPRTGDLYGRSGYEGYASNHAQYILNYLGLYHIQGYPFTFIGIPQGNYRIGDLHVIVEGSGGFIDEVTFNGFSWKSLKLPANVKDLSGVLKIKLTDSDSAWKKSRFILPDNGYYALKSITDRPLAKKFTFTVSSPVSETHKINLYFEDNPRNVSGVESWSYNPENKILSLTVKTNSDSTVTIDYGEAICPDRFAHILTRYGVEATVKRNLPKSTDEYGNLIENWVEIDTENVIVKVLKSRETFLIAGVMQEANAKALLKSASLIEPGDRIHLGESEVYQVLTLAPRRVGKCVHHLEAILKRVVEE